MEKQTFSGVLENAYGSQLATPVKYSGTFDAFTSIDEVKSSNNMPNDEEILAFVNTKRKNNERQKAMTAALEAAGISKPDPNSPDVILANQIKGLDKLDVPADQKEMMIQMLTAAANKAKAEGKQ